MLRKAEPWPDRRAGPGRRHRHGLRRHQHPHRAGERRAAPAPRRCDTRTRAPGRARRRTRAAAGRRRRRRRSCAAGSRELAAVRRPASPTPSSATSPPRCSAELRGPALPGRRRGRPRPRTPSGGCATCSTRSTRARPRAVAADGRGFLGHVSGPRPRSASSSRARAPAAAPSGGALRRRFAEVDELYADGPRCPTAGDMVATEVAQPRIVTGSLAGLRVLAALGIEATVAVGHSLGELSALHWAGALDEAALLRVAAVRGRTMAEQQRRRARWPASAPPAERSPRADRRPRRSSSPATTARSRPWSPAPASAIERASGAGRERGPASPHPAAGLARLPLAAGRRRPPAPSGACAGRQTLRAGRPARWSPPSPASTAARRHRPAGAAATARSPRPVRSPRRWRCAAKDVDLFIEVGARPGAHRPGRRRRPTSRRSRWTPTTSRWPALLRGRGRRLRARGAPAPTERCSTAGSSGRWRSGRTFPSSSPAPASRRRPAARASHAPRPARSADGEPHRPADAASCGRAGRSAGGRVTTPRRRRARSAAATGRRAGRAAAGGRRPRQPAPRRPAPELDHRRPDRQPRRRAGSALPRAQAAANFATATPARARRGADALIRRPATTRVPLDAAGAAPWVRGLRGRPGRAAGPRPPRPAHRRRLERVRRPTATRWPSRCAVQLERGRRRRRRPGLPAARAARRGRWPWPCRGAKAALRRRPGTALRPGRRHGARRGRAGQDAAPGGAAAARHRRARATAGWPDAACDRIVAEVAATTGFTEVLLRRGTAARRVPDAAGRCPVDAASAPRRRWTPPTCCWSPAAARASPPSARWPWPPTAGAAWPCSAAPTRAGRRARRQPEAAWPTRACSVHYAARRRHRRRRRSGPRSTS